MTVLILTHSLSLSLVPKPTVSDHFIYGVHIQCYPQAIDVYDNAINDHRLPRWTAEMDFRFPGTPTPSEVLSELQVDPQSLTRAGMQFDSSWFKDSIKRATSELVMEPLWENRWRISKNLKRLISTKRDHSFAGFVDKSDDPKWSDLLIEPGMAIQGCAFEVGSLGSSLSTTLNAVQPSLICEYDPGRQDMFQMTTANVVQCGMRYGVTVGTDPPTAPVDPQSMNMDECPSGIELRCTVGVLDRNGNSVENEDNPRISPSGTYVPLQCVNRHSSSNPSCSAADGVALGFGYNADTDKMQVACCKIDDTASIDANTAFGVEGQNMPNPLRVRRLSGENDVRISHYSSWGGTHLLLIHTLYALCALILYSLCIHSVFTLYSLCIHSVFTVLS